MRLALFRNEFNKFNNTGARLIDSIYHMPLNYFRITFLDFAIFYTMFTVIMYVIV